MIASHYIGFDVHKKTISFCVKTAAGEIVEEGSTPAERGALRRWVAARPQPWRGAMEATLFSGWIYDTLKPYGEQLEMAHPAKKQNGRAADGNRRCLREREVNPNSYFVDRVYFRFPQMDVWPSCCFGRYAGSHAVR